MAAFRRRARGHRPGLCGEGVFPGLSGNLLYHTSKGLPLEGKVAAQPTDEVGLLVWECSSIPAGAKASGFDAGASAAPPDPRTRGIAPGPFAGASAAPATLRQGVPPWTRYAKSVGFVKEGFSAYCLRNGRTVSTGIIKRRLLPEIVQARSVSSLSFSRMQSIRLAAFRRRARGHRPGLCGEGVFPGLSGNLLYHTSKSLPLEGKVAAQPTDEVEPACVGAQFNSGWCESEWIRCSAPPGTPKQHREIACGLLLRFPVDVFMLFRRTRYPRFLGTGEGKCPP